MSWTVHEEEPNFDEILHQTNNPGNLPKPKPGKYTQSSQVFATPGSNGAPDANVMPKDTMEPVNPWMRNHTPTNGISGFPSPLMHQGSPLGKYGGQQQMPPPHQHHHQQQQQAPLRYTGNMYQAPPKNMNTNDIYAGNGMHRGSGTSPMMGGDHRKNILSTDDLASQDSGNLSFPEWSGSYNNGGKYSPQSPYTNVTAESLQGKVYETAKDQHGCRFLQRWLDTNRNPEAVDVIMKEIIPHVAELMTDQYANFLVQKLFDVMPDEVRYNVAQVAAPDISKIALTPHGTFSVQKMIETISTREEMEIVRTALSKDVVLLVKDTHGNHVIQKVLQRFDYEDKEFIYEAVMSDCVAIAKNKQGCCVLQRCLEYASQAQKTALVAHILSCCLQVVQDPFGNYVLQYVLEAKDSKINDTIAIAFLPHLVQLCMNKFSSNVMEKVLRGASSHVQAMYVDMMCDPDIVTRLIQDDYGNYVLQTALSICAPSQTDALVNTIRPLMPMIKNAPYAKKLEGKIEAITKSGPGGGSVGNNSYSNSNPEYDMAGTRGNVHPNKYYYGGNNNNNNNGSHHNNNNGYNNNGHNPHHHHHRMNNENRAAPWQPS